jgi:hypothetical protein
VAITLRAIRASWSVRSRLNESATHFVFGRSSRYVPPRLMKMPTETGSTCTGPSERTCSYTASKIARSRSWPVAKYSSNGMAGAHSCD